LGRRQLLAPGTRVTDPVEVARRMVALHGTDPSTVYLSAWARMNGGDVAAMERALYEERTLMRLLAMRRTVFVVPVEVAPAVLAASSRLVAANERKKLLQMLTEAKVAPNVDEWLAEAERIALAALTKRGEATGAELNSDHPLLRTELVLARGKAYEGKQKVGSRVLALLATDGHAVRGRPLGSWTSTQFRWSPVERWFPGGLVECAVEEAEAELARRWLRTFGPATPDDLRWWTGWTMTTTKRVLGRLGVVGVDLDGEKGVLLADDLEPEPTPTPWVALLPALDPTPMGWLRRDFYLGEHGPLLFDNTGNVSPTVWCDGRIVGGWAQRKSGEVVYKLLEDIGSEATATVATVAGELTEKLGDVRLTTRARRSSPVEAELLNG
jgi:hypothetical protein